MNKKSLNNIKLPYRSGDVQSHEPVLVRCRVLIVSEGEKTEPNYFKSFNMMQRGGIVFEVESKGDGENTIQVVDEAIRLRDCAEYNDNPFDSVWAVFDKDSFADKDFNAAIEMAKQHDIHTAWSNEAFELWYVLHFQYRNTAMSRTEYKAEITKRVNEAGFLKKNYKYQKNAKNSKEIMSHYGSEDEAIRNAERLEKTYADKRYARHNPCTTVYKLVRLLRGEDKIFNAIVMEKLNAN